MIGGLTYVTLLDVNQTDPQQGLHVQVFADYNEAMSYAKWATFWFSIQETTSVYVWNWNGGSGKWTGSSFTDIANSNYPTP